MYNNNNRFLNTKLNTYCRDVMNDSIKRIGEKYNLERKTKTVINNDCLEISIPNKHNKYNNEPYFLIFLGILSIPTLTYYFYKKFKRE